ncbi:hypothetical protein V1477_000563 [Vespula maculifrons]|uniref:Uncharacterized protein n=1 Tax=Vespula maculifrons TaxID=7453 RepID=A0ABD2D3B5_VESMC
MLFTYLHILLLYRNHCKVTKCKNDSTFELRIGIILDQAFVYERLRKKTKWQLTEISTSI